MLVDELKPSFAKGINQNLLFGESEGGKVFAFWLYLYANNMAKANIIMDIIDSALKGSDGFMLPLKQYGVTESVANFYCNTEQFDNKVVIYDEDLDGQISLIMIISLEQLKAAVKDYLLCLKMGLRKSSGFVFIYKAEGKKALDEYKKLQSE